MKLQITPQPSEDERAAIEAALAEEAETPASTWPQAVLPGRDELGTLPRNGFVTESAADRPVEPTDAAGARTKR
jgi:hypothetical protein